MLAVESEPGMQESNNARAVPVTAALAAGRRSAHDALKIGRCRAPLAQMRAFLSGRSLDTMPTALHCQTSKPLKNSQLSSAARTV